MSTLEDDACALLGLPASVLAHLESLGLPSMPRSLCLFSPSFPEGELGIYFWGSYDISILSFIQRPLLYCYMSVLTTKSCMGRTMF